MHSIPHSFDTIKLRIPTVDCPDLDSKFPIMQEFHRENPDGSRRSSQYRHFLSGTNKYESAPSWWSPPSVSVIGPEIELSFSLPKLWFGHSARHAGIDELEAALQGWELWFLQHKQVQTVPWADWQIREIHFCYNFDLVMPSRVEDAVGQLRRLRYRGKLAFQDKKGVHAYWQGAYRTIKFYQKGLEMWEHRKAPRSHYDEAWLDKRMYPLNCILRFEEEWRGKQLIQFCGIRNIKDVGKNKLSRSNYFGSDLKGEGNSKDFQKTSLINQVTVSKFLARLSKFSVNEHLQFVQSNFTNRSPADGLETARNIIRAQRRSEETLYFLDAVLSRGLSNVKKDYPKSTFYACKKRMEELGLPIEYFDTFYDDDAVDEFGKMKRWNPVDISNYINPDNFCSRFNKEDISEDPIYLEVQSLARETLSGLYNIG